MIYHGCGNATKIFEDFIEIGVDSYNPLEAKSGLDVVELAAEVRPPHGVLREHGRPEHGPRAGGGAAPLRACASSTRPRAAATSSSPTIRFPATSRERGTSWSSSSSARRAGTRSHLGAFDEPVRGTRAHDLPGTGPDGLCPPRAGPCPVPGADPRRSSGTRRRRPLAWTMRDCAGASATISAACTALTRAGRWPSPTARRGEPVRRGADRHRLRPAALSSRCPTRKPRRRPGTTRGRTRMGGRVRRQGGSGQLGRRVRHPRRRLVAVLARRDRPRRAWRGCTT